MLAKLCSKSYKLSFNSTWPDVLPDVQARFGKGRGTRDQIANIQWIMEKAREFQKTIYFHFIDYAKAFDCVDHSELWKILKEMGIPDQLSCLLRNLYASQEATVRTGCKTTDWFKIGKGVLQGYILSLCLFNLYAEYIIRNARLDESQAGIKIARRNTDNLRYANDTTLMAESKEELKSLLRVEEETEKAGLKPNIQKTKILASGLIVPVCLVAQSCPTLCDHLDCGLLWSMELFRLEYWSWLLFSSSRGSSQPRNRTYISRASGIAGRFFTHWTIGKIPFAMPFHCK